MTLKCHNNQTLECWQESHLENEPEKPLES